MTIKNDESLAEFSIENTQDGTSILAYDPFLKENVAKIHLNVADNTPLLSCNGSGISLDTCNISENDHYILLRGSDNTLVKKGRALELVLNNSTVLSIDNRGIISKYPNISLELDTKIDRNFMSIKILSGNTQIGSIVYKWNASSIITSSSSTLSETLEKNRGKIVLETISANYGSTLSSL